MKKNLILCYCGSGMPKEFCCEKKPQIKVWAKPLNSSEERQELLRNLNISSEFGMRYRGLLEYYGKDLIAYKLEHRFNSDCNEFLHYFSKYMTTYLEDDCPPAWVQCNSSFWEELIFTYLPLNIKITPHKREVETFLSELKSFVRWIDKRIGTSWYEVVKKYIEEAGPTLNQCEQLLNQLFLINYPKIHQSNWNYKQDSEKIEQEFQKTVDRLDSIFEVTHVLEDIVFLTELKSKRCYPIKGLTCNIIFPGMLLDGVLGRRSGNNYWNWFLTNSVFPNRARKYIIFV